AVTDGHAHAAESERRNIRSVPAKFSLLHAFLLNKLLVKPQRPQRNAQQRQAYGTPSCFSSVISVFSVANAFANVLIYFA
ncbi:MAG: hypothetical protein Q8L40_07620, partial [Burkholderiales bacterium]|nr:hypothetical protein [Burkholderiales bacterium]